MQILLVEDEQSILHTTAELLTDLGYAVRCAENGEEVLQMLDTHSVDLVVSDIRMPRMDGLQLLRILRAQKPELPVILTTGHGDQEIAVRAEQEGAYSFLRKPIKVQELLAAIKSIESRIRSEPQKSGEGSQNVPVPPQG